MKTLLIVDLQNDFLPGGALPAPDGNQIIPVVNNIMDKFDLITASKDWHPEDTVHFEKWPVHCVQNTPGSDFPNELETGKIDTFLHKGTKNTDDGYSAFEATNINLDNFLKEKGVTELYVCGLTTEYCVKNSVLDALSHHYKTYVIKDAVAGVKAHPGDEDKAWQEMKVAGATIITSENI
ncbi:isochorismatase family protein [Abyssalbus ytuae]|uniref:nicotinamidase n=1 Tax=Abyssalbus ytuae TaxID=2926907 RepID=A0A9E6ZMY7_9FLAO|nr:isochorismatase family protein [Abyssalbus ytuae]UOB18827.1 isochorismatase family protein [Abyssalbus ytuae]